MIYIIQKANHGGAHIAQLGERLIRIQKVTSSTLVVGSNNMLIFVERKEFVTRISKIQLVADHCIVDGKNIVFVYNIDAEKQRTIIVVLGSMNFEDMRDALKMFSFYTETGIGLITCRSAVDRGLGYCYPVQNDIIYPVAYTEIPWPVGLYLQQPFKTNELDDVGKVLLDLTFGSR